MEIDSKRNNKRSFVQCKTDLTNQGSNYNLNETGNGTNQNEGQYQQRNQEERYKFNEGQYQQPNQEERYKFNKYIETKETQQDRSKSGSKVVPLYSIKSPVQSKSTLDWSQVDTIQNLNVQTCPLPPIIQVNSPTNLINLNKNQYSFNHATQINSSQSCMKPILVRSMSDNSAQTMPNAIQRSSSEQHNNPSGNQPENSKPSWKLPNCKMC